MWAENLRCTGHRFFLLSMQPRAALEMYRFTSLSIMGEKHCTCENGRDTRRFRRPEKIIWSFMLFHSFDFWIMFLPANCQAMNRNKRYFLTRTEGIIVDPSDGVADGTSLCDFGAHLDVPRNDVRIYKIQMADDRIKAQPSKSCKLFWHKGRDLEGLHILYTFILKVEKHLSEATNVIFETTESCQCARRFTY